MEIDGRIKHLLKPTEKPKHESFAARNQLFREKNKNNRYDSHILTFILLSIREIFS